LPGFREAVKPRLVGGDRSHGATFFTPVGFNIANRVFFCAMQTSDCKGGNGLKL
jgi:hypothetical protein